MKELCRQDICAYINLFVWQYNPRKAGGGEAGPFILWPFQVNVVRTILGSIECNCNQSDSLHGHDLLIEKSREMGASWLCLIVMEWLWHFHPWRKFLCISRSEDAVEAEDPDSLFWKIDFIHCYLPGWLKPNMKRRKLFFGNDDNHSTITGQASTGRAGVGGRATAMFIDEFSQIKEDFEVLGRTSDTTSCRIFNGTHRGTGTAFHKLSERPDMRKLVMHWSQHPDKCKGIYKYDAAKNKIEVIDKQYKFAPDFKFVYSELPAGGPYPGLRSPWYDEQAGRKGSNRDVAEDLDINPAGSQEQFFNALTIAALRKKYCFDPLWEGEIVYDRDTGRPDHLARCPGGTLKLWLYPNSDGRIPMGAYGAGVDVSTGIGRTNSAMSIVNARTGEKVGEYATCTMLPEQFATACVAICWMFKDETDTPALLGWENAGPGGHFGKVVVGLGYPHLHYRRSLMDGTRGLMGKEPGWMPNIKNKRELLESYRQALYELRIINRSDIALEECGPYHYEGGRGGTVVHPHEVISQDPTGAKENHGDRVIADALAWKMAESLNVYVGQHREQKKEEQVCSYEWRRKIAEGQKVIEESWATRSYDGWRTASAW